jgi:hypothetical protein
MWRASRHRSARDGVCPWRCRMARIGWTTMSEDVDIMDIVRVTGDFPSGGLGARRQPRAADGATVLAASRRFGSRGSGRRSPPLPCPQRKGATRLLHIAHRRARLAHSTGRRHPRCGCRDALSHRNVNVRDMGREAASPTRRIWRYFPFCAGPVSREGCAGDFRKSTNPINGSELPCTASPCG